MAEQKYTADEAAFKQAVSSFELTSQELDREIQKLRGEMSGTLLSASQYAGAQAGAFVRTHAEIEQHIQGATRQLQTMSELVHSARTNYATGDSTAADSIAQVNNLIPQGGSILNAM